MKLYLLDKKDKDPKKNYQKKMNFQILIMHNSSIKTNKIRSKIQIPINFIKKNNFVHKN
jgi:hypothetical protein